MIKKAVHSHNAATPSHSPPVASRQQSLGSAFARNAPAQRQAPRPLASSSKQNGTGKSGLGNFALGTKRTASGLAKSLGSQDDSFSYPHLQSAGVGKENHVPTTRTAVSRTNSTGLATALYDEDDFDSDIDIDMEVDDPATEATVQYPSLPKLESRASADSGYQSRLQTIQPDSSQSIPWSSSPVEHFRTPVKPQAAQPKSRRACLPWSQNQKAAAVSQRANDRIEDEDDDKEVPRPKKRQTVKPPKAEPAATPATKNQYPWNTTASALKEQQKNLREQNKKRDVEAVSIDDLKDAAKKRKEKGVARLFLSEEQQNVLNLVTEHKKSVFFTGSAGTGKSILLQEIIKALRRKYLNQPDCVAVTASTGLASCNIGGVTLHSFSGIGLGDQPIEELIKRIRRNQKAKQRWLRAKVLVMDEVSMVSGPLFDMLEQIARTIRNNGRPFGGIQLVVTGDFFQLPPVMKGSEPRFAFEAGTWSTSIDHTIGLTHIFRQKDPVFANMLNEMREGRLSPDSISRFRRLDRPLPASEENIEATELFPTRVEVDRANNLRMQQLHGTMFRFEARDGGAVTNKEHRDKLLEGLMAPEVVNLKKGAQVMLVKNMDDTLVNGSLGKVINFMSEPMFNLYKEDEEAFLEGGASEAAAKLQMAQSTLGISTTQVYPVVRFANADGTTRDLLCKREDWKIELPNGQVQASRSQIPLILAWALSIHKAQGQTLERVRVDLGKVFEKGQAYVALSRATSMAGLQILRFNPTLVKADDKVRSFYSSLSRAEQAQGSAKSKTILGKMQAANAKKRGAKD